MKWWISDFDGTLTKINSELIEQRELNFIKEWCRKNKFLIATGRDKEYVCKLKEKYDFNYEYMIVNNGATLYKNEKLIFNIEIDMNKRTKIIEALKRIKGNFGIRLVDDKNSFTYKNFESKLMDSMVMDWWINLNQDFLALEKIILKNKYLNTICLFLENEDVSEPISLFKNIGNLKIMNTEKHLLEIVNSNTSKSKGILYLKNKYKIKECNLFVTGNDINDVEMLKDFKNSFVLNTSLPEVLKTGKHIIESVIEIKNYLNVEE
ncbi:HAD family phosphatase [Mesoplasma chauliocola]|uniref:HAD family phosphatase n=1 Tax=Mesoplasma chauliocola TaxID=216427 RepID=A0A249SPQ0_9MOLU|nr:HAD family hydrolase [Mesoplasma chauliocola]ASZ09451.1 HAD family phosphatase [Mesoplasma chauliocola]